VFFRRVDPEPSARARCRRIQLVRDAWFWVQHELAVSFCQVAARPLPLVLVGLLCQSALCAAQTSAMLQGRVFDVSEAVIPGAAISVRNDPTEFAVTVRADQDGRYRVLAIPTGTYIVTVEAPGFRTEIIDELIVDVGRTLVRDFRLALADQHETVVVTADFPLVDRATTTVGEVVTTRTIEQIPLNGRHFIDLSLLVPGSVAPSQNGFSSRPIRGVGALAFNIAGNREEAVGFVVNGVTTNNLTFGSLIFEPPVGSIQQFTVDSSALDAEYGHVSGAIANIVTRSGTDAFRGDLFEFFRNDALDARNFFEFTTAEPHPFTRNQFGGSAGGPIWRGRAFFFAAYEGFRQQQGVDMNSLVLSDAQRSAATDPVVRQLIPLIPRANYFDTDGTPRFVGSAPAVANTDRWTTDLRYNASRRDRLQAFYGSQQIHANEPGSQGNSIPGFGQVSQPFASILTVTETHILRDTIVNEVRFGRSRLEGGTFPAAPLNPADFGIGNGVTSPIGLPQMIVAGALNFGGPGTLPQGRFDTSYVVNDTFSRASGRHSMKMGGEYRHFINQNFAQGTGVFNFPSVNAFLAGAANAFNITLGRRTSVIDQRALSLFAQDNVTIHDTFTVNFGLRYEWHVTPTERDDKFVVFDASRAWLRRVFDDEEEIYRQNNLNLEPRVGLAWDLGADGRTVLRAAYAQAADEPGTTAVRDTAGNPPFAAPLAANGSLSIENALDATRPVGLAPATVDPGFHNAWVQSWNVNVQRQVARDTAVTVGYLGSHGRNLRISRNINQPIDGARPFAAVSATSPILPGAPLGNITQVESSGFSRYNGAWASVTKRLSHGLQTAASYTWSKSLDTNSLNSSGFAVQDSYNIAGQYGLSDFDARNRFVATAIYDFPFTGHILSRGWQVAAVVQAQSGNPVNIVTSNSSLNGVPNSVRPDVTGPVRIIGSVDQWFDPTAFVATNRFGNLGRNAVIGPAFNNTDVSVVKHLSAGRVDAQFRVDVFDLFNHPNFGAPGNVVGSPTFGKISSTRLPTGEAGSSRQIQIAVRLSI
jgi:carboxypeptidase family protein/TonB-dependent receptor-like protein